MSASISDGGFGQLDLEEPAGGQRVAVGKGRVGAQGFVDFGDLARDGGVDVGGGLDRLDHAGHFLGGEALADFRQVDEDHVAQRVLRVDGDAHGGDAVGGVDPLVVGGVLDAHGEAP
ncbi:hypothetical protein Ddc_20123 [Ditylenchus destructor]|nr:hypothetical protein Ddc_20123 [Ditylenchus destructor]